MDMLESLVKKPKADLVGGCMRSLLLKTIFIPLSWSDCLKIMKGIVKGLAYVSDFSQKLSNI